MRSPLCQQLIHAWQRCIQQDYRACKINSERTLQAALWCHLQRSLKPQWKLFIEPTIRIDGKTRIVPDIVICNTRSLIGVIELKYLPRIRPNHIKDLYNLCRLSSLSANRVEIGFEHRRDRGKGSPQPHYRLLPSTLFVWAGIHADKASEDERMFSDECASLKGRYLQLQAVTRETGPPSILVNAKPHDSRHICPTRK